MKKKSKHPLYETPRALDFSHATAYGQVTPQGVCFNGSSPSDPISTCTDGNYPSSTPSTCAPVGNIPQYGKCAAGTNVANLCINGSFVTT